MSSLPRNVESLQNVKQSRLAAIVILVSFVLGACVQPQPKPDLAAQTTANPSQPTELEPIPIPEKLPCTKQCEAEINRLKKQLKEKGDLLRSYQAQLKDQKPPNSENGRIAARWTCIPDRLVHQSLESEGHALLRQHSFAGDRHPPVAR